MDHGRTERLHSRSYRRALIELIAEKGINGQNLGSH